MSISTRRREEGMKKQGDLGDGTEASHIFSYEVLRAIDPKNLYRGSETYEAMDDSRNLRIKTKAGNRNCTDNGKFAPQPYTNDRYLDSLIIDAIKRTNKKLTCKLAVERLKRAWESVQIINLPEGLKEMIRHEFSQIRTEDDQVIVEENSSLYA